MGLVNIDTMQMPTLPTSILSAMSGSAPVSPSAGADVTAAGAVPAEDITPTVTGAPVSTPAATTPSDISAATIPSVPEEDGTKKVLRALGLLASFIAPPVGLAAGIMLGPNPQQKAMQQAKLRKAQADAATAVQQAQAGLGPSDLDIAKTNQMNAQTDLLKLQIAQMRDPENVELQKQKTAAEIKYKNADADYRAASASHQQKLADTQLRIESAVGKMFDDVVRKRRDLKTQPWDANERAVLSMYGLFKQMGSQMGALMNPDVLGSLDDALTKAGVPTAPKAAVPGAGVQVGKTAVTLPKALQGVKGTKGKDRYTSGGKTWDWNYSTGQWVSK